MINDNPCDSKQLLETAIAARDVIEQLRIEDRAKIKNLEALCRKLADTCENAKVALAISLIAPVDENVATDKDIVKTVIKGLEAVLSEARKAGIVT